MARLANDPSFVACRNSQPCLESYHVFTNPRICAFSLVRGENLDLLLHSELFFAQRKKAETIIVQPTIEAAQFSCCIIIIKSPACLPSHAHKNHRVLKSRQLQAIATSYTSRPTVPGNVGGYSVICSLFLYTVVTQSFRTYGPAQQHTIMVAVIVKVAAPTHTSCTATWPVRDMHLCTLCQLQQVLWEQKPV